MYIYSKVVKLLETIGLAVLIFVRALLLGLIWVAMNSSVALNGRNYRAAVPNPLVKSCGVWKTIWVLFGLYTPPACQHACLAHG